MSQYKYYKITVVYILMIGIFNACGGGGGDGSPSTPSISTTKHMTIDTPYTVKKGTKIQKIDAQSTLMLEVDLHSGLTTVTLKTGDATLEVK